MVVAQGGVADESGDVDGRLGVVHGGDIGGEGRIAEDSLSPSRFIGSGGAPCAA